ncbi:hypothetical protein LMG28138_06096 [Pararobbsia alpina]|uniref:Uncharacterized protein n=1 Tax=Pararobbsia alpina TaxID=621374 RepID=A0A6S7D7A3_9BURK|nr:hypothetical protein LMG28138_06096 [Pararobbsia alpina]
MGQPQLLPRDDDTGPGGGDERPRPLCQRRVGSKEHLNLPRARGTETRDHFPPLAPTWDPHGQVGQCRDTVRSQGRHGPSRQPEVDVVADSRIGYPSMPQHVDGLVHCPRLPQTLPCCVREDGDKIGAPDLPGDVQKPAPDDAKDATCRPPVAETRRQVPLDGLARREPGVPGAQRGQFVRIGKRYPIVFRGSTEGVTHFHERQF